MKKDILTREKIKQDYKAISLKGTLQVILGAIVFIVLLSVIIYLTIQLGYSGGLKGIVTILCLVFVILLLLYIIYDSLKQDIKIRNNKFYITTDKLIACKAKDLYCGSTKKGSKPYELQFTSYGEYYIPEFKNYHYSKAVAMSDTEVFNCSDLGDTFYLVICNNKIVLAYNTKLFELQDEKTVSNFR